MADKVDITWIILNVIVLIYAIVLIIYGMYFRKNEILSLVINNILINFFIQKNYPGDSKGIHRMEDSIRVAHNNIYSNEDKNINLIENQAEMQMKYRLFFNKNDKCILTNYIKY